jgi:integrase
MHVTMAELCDLYLAEGCTGKKPSTILMDRSRVERHVKPLVGAKEVVSLTRGDLEQLMADIARGRSAIDEKTKKQGRAIVTGGKGTATRVMGMVGAMLNFAVARGLRPDNPAVGVKRFPDRKMERFLSSEEMQQLAASFSAAEARGDNLFALAAIRLLALTAARKGEILNLRWEWVHLERACLGLPDSKTGAKVIPLGSPAVDILKTLPRVKGNCHVIVGAVSGRPLVGLQKIWARIRAEAGMPDLRLHDLRHHFISTGASAGESLYILGRVAGHRQANTTQRYAHLADDPVRQTAERISTAISIALKQVSTVDVDGR